MGKLRLREIKKLALNYIAVKWLSWDLNSGLPNRWTHLAPMITDNINLVPTNFYIPDIYWMASIHYPPYTALQPHKAVPGILTQLRDRGLWHTVFGLFYALNKFPSWIYEHFPGASDGKESTCKAGDQVWYLGWEYPLEEEMATHSSILAWRIPWTEEPGRLLCMGLQRAGHDWMTNTFTFHFHALWNLCIATFAWMNISHQRKWKLWSKHNRIPLSTAGRSISKWIYSTETNSFSGKAYWVF